MELALGFGTYVCSVVLGVIAWRTRIHLGIWHHIAYAAAIVGTGIALISSLHVFLFVPAACLVLMPIYRGRSTPHKLIGLVGLAGYIVTLLTL